jgi:hypothetical protein
MEAGGWMRSEMKRKMDRPEKTNGDKLSLSPFHCMIPIATIQCQSEKLYGTTRILYSSSSAVQPFNDRPILLICQAECNGESRATRIGPFDLHPTVLCPGGLSECLWPVGQAPFPERSSGQPRISHLVQPNIFHN